MPNSQFDDIPLKPRQKPLSALAKNTQLNQERFDGAQAMPEVKQQTEKKIPAPQMAKTIEQPVSTLTKLIKKAQKPRYYVASFRLLDEDIKYIQQLAKNNKVSPRDVVKTMIDFYKENN